MLSARGPAAVLPRPAGPRPGSSGFTARSPEDRGVGGWCLLGLTGSALGRRLRPLYAAVFLQNFALWVPIEKLFMTSIGFDAASVGAIAVVVPVFEVPSGILADRWSRRGVLILGMVAAIGSVVVGGLSHNVVTYMVAALFLGVFFAMQSGTLESMVYDTPRCG